MEYEVSLYDFIRTDANEDFVTLFSCIIVLSKLFGIFPVKIKNINGFKKFEFQVMISLYGVIIIIACLFMTISETNLIKRQTG